MLCFRRLTGCPAASDSFSLMHFARSLRASFLFAVVMHLYMCMCRHAMAHTHTRRASRFSKCFSMCTSVHVTLRSEAQWPFAELRLLQAVSGHMVQRSLKPERIRNQRESARRRTFDIAICFCSFSNHRKSHFPFLLCMHFLIHH